jgi:hypothetical protein
MRRSLSVPPQPVEPDGQAGQPAEAGGGWLGSVSRGVKWFVGVVVVALVGALAAAFVAHLEPAGELSARLKNVSIDRNVTPAEYDARYRSDHASTRRSSRPAVRVAAYVIAQATPGAATSAERSTTPTGSSSPTGSTTPAGSSSPTGSTSPTATPARADDPVVALKLGPTAQKRLDTGVLRALEDPSVPDLDLGAACTRDLSGSDCALQSLQRQLQLVQEDGTPGTVRTATIARRLVKIFRGTRTRRSTSGHGKRQPVGVTVNFNASLSGFNGKRVSVRWSLFNAKSGRRVPHDWLRNQRAVVLKGKAAKHDRSSQFWAPVPKAKGVYFIRVGIYDDEDDTRLDYANTPHFH